MDEKSNAMHKVVETLERELPKYCKQNMVQYVLWPMIERQLRTRMSYIRLGNLVVEVATPGGNLEVARLRLFHRMSEVASAAPWLDAVCGVVTDGVHAEYYTLIGGSPELKMRGSLGEILAAALATLCADKLPIISPEDIAVIFGM